MIVRYNVSIKGHVQKVGFRFQTHLAASRYNIKGWVRNDEEGAVQIAAEGEEKDMEDFLEWCRQGPPGSLIVEIDFRKAPVSGFDDFVIQRSQ